jgi:hypothetical protein
MGWFGSRKEGGGGRRESRISNYDSPVSGSSAEYHREEDDVVSDDVSPVSAPVVSNYVAPSPVAAQAITEVVSSTAGNNEDGVLSGGDETADSFDDVNGNPSSFTRGTEVDAENAMFSDDAKNSHINSLFNGHLMKWKFEAEEGTGFLRVPACKSCTGLLAAVTRPRLLLLPRHFK